MSSPNFTTTITVENTAKEVFDAINNVRGWWSEEIVGTTDVLNEEWDYHYQDAHRCKMKIIELIPNEKVVWLVLDNYFSFTKDKSEWIGDTIVFEITEKDNKRQLQVTQVGLTSENECYDICENAWTTYIHKSLYNLITTGKGHPNSSENSQTEDEKNLTTNNYTTTFFIDQSPEEVFASINNVRGWWQGEIEGDTDKVDAEFTYRMDPHHYSKQKITELIPNEKVVWLVTESEINFVSDKSEWAGTKIVFDIKEINNKTQVRFTHIGLAPYIECYGDCSNAWQRLMQESLVSLITTGEGTKVFG